ncbi:MAG TPA: hypothetical protein VFP60_11650 [Pseudolabrys sp.]|nr:hypothetical protein [Pseudolabrys sp.]
MRAWPALSAFLVCAAGYALAQTVIDIDTQRAAEPSVQQTPAGAPEAQPEQQSGTRSGSEVGRNDSELGGQSSGQGRFSFNRLDDGLLRLDNATGQITFCREQKPGWVCLQVPEQRAVLQSDLENLDKEVTSLKREIASLTALKTSIARLESEIVRLKDEIASIKNPPPRPPAEVDPALREHEPTSRLPTQEHLARARQFLEKTWRGLVTMVADLQKGIMEKI